MRFPGFEGEWRRRRLGEVGEIISGLTYSPNDIADDGVLVLRSSNVQRRRLAFVDNVFVKTGNFNPVLEDDILICVRNGSQNLIGKNALIKKEHEGLAFGAFMTIYRSSYNPFLFHWFDTEEYKSEVYKNLGATINSINGSDLKRFKVPFPSEAEQKKIASFLSLLDERIATQNKIIENLETLIKGLSESLFNQKLRFKNESGEYFPDWKIQKLGQVFTFKITNSYSREKLNYAEGCVKNIHYGDIHTKYRTLFNAQKESIPYINVDVNISRIGKENYCKEGDLIIADASEDLKDVGKGIEIVSLDGQKILAGLHTILARPSLNIFSIGFCGYLLKTEKIRLQIQKEAQGSKVLSISNTRLSNVVLCIPSLEEQTQIVNFLSGIDQKIETEKRILKRYEFQKKHFLRVLFI